MALPLLASAGALAERTGRSESDPDLLAALRDASSRFRGAVGHDVTRTVVLEAEFEGNGGAILFLPVHRLVSVDAVRVDDVLLTRQADYTVSRASGLIARRGRAWPTDLGSVQVDYTYGYDVSDEAKPAGWQDDKILWNLPEVIQTAVLGMAQTILNTEVGIAGRTVLGDNVQYGSAATVGTTQDWADVVAAHRVGYRG